MTTPNQPAPSGAYIIGDGNSFGQGMTPEMAIAQMTGQAEIAYNVAAGEWGNVYDEFGDRVEAIEDGQTDLGDRVDLLEGVYGYGNCFLSNNWFVSGGARRTLPFDTQLGPSVNVEFESDGIMLGTKGLWRADAHIPFAPGESNFFTATPSPVQVYLQVLDTVTANNYTEHRYDVLISTQGAESCSFAHTFVVPEDNRYLVRVQVNTSVGRVYLYGGSSRSGLSVNKWSGETTNNEIQPVVPDGGTLS